MSYDDWNKVEDDENEELQDFSFFDGKRDVVLFAIDCSESMQAPHDNTDDGSQKMPHLFQALDAAMQFQKRKVVVGPNDSVGILLFNTTRKNESTSRGSTEFKNGTYLFEPLGPIDAPKITHLSQLLHEARENHKWLPYEFPPSPTRTPMGDVFTSCNWALRDGAPKAAIKRVFLITDEDDPHPGAKSAQLVTSAQTTLLDLTQSGVSVEPFFVSTESRPFDPHKFYSAVFDSISGDDDDDESDGLLPGSLSISRIDDLLSQMRFREMPKRALFSVPFELGDGFVIGVKGYGLVTEQKKGTYRYFMDLGDKLEVVEPKTLYMDENEQREAQRETVVYGMELGGPPPENAGEEEFGVRAIPKRNKVFYTSEEVRSFRTLGLKAGIKLLGFKDETELAIEDNIKHSFFIYPDEAVYAGSKRSFSALLKAVKKKGKIGLVRALLRSNSTPMFCALCPQEERIDEDGFSEPSGFHLIPLPFADDIRAAPLEESLRAKSKAIDAAKLWITKLQIKNGGYPPDANPNPALAYHYAQLEASAFREEFDPDSFEDPTKPKIDMIHKRAGPLIKEWKDIIDDDEDSKVTIVQKAGAPGVGTKRKADTTVDEAEIRSKYDGGKLSGLRVDQLKSGGIRLDAWGFPMDFLKSKSLALSGKKGELVERVAEYLDKH